MLDFSFTHEQEEFRSKVRQFVEKEIAPHAAERDKREQLPFEAIKSMGEFGLIGITYPKRLGGQEKQWIDHSIALEEVARGDYSCAMILGMLVVYTKLLENNDDLIRSVIQGDKVLAFAETEAHSGGDAAGIKSEALRQDDHYVINGEKYGISLVPGAQFMVVTALTRPDLGGVKGMSMFLIEADRPGVKIDAIPEPGLRAHMLGRITLTDVKIPASNLIGEENKGFYQMRSRWDFTRGVGGPLQLVWHGRY